MVPHPHSELFSRINNQKLKAEKFSHSQGKTETRKTQKSTHDVALPILNDVETPQTTQPQKLRLQKGWKTIKEEPPISRAEDSFQLTELLNTYKESVQLITPHCREIPPIVPPKTESVQKKKIKNKKKESSYHFLKSHWKAPSITPSLPPTENHYSFAAKQWWVS